MEDFSSLVQREYNPVIKQYDFKVAQFDKDEMFLIGKGFGLYVFFDPRDGSNTWYVSLDAEGNIIVRTLDYIFAERLTEDIRNQHFAVHEKPKSIYENVIADLSISNIVLLNCCHDILSGDSNWLQDYPDKGHYNPHIARFLAPYFQKQGYFVKSTKA